MTPKLIEDQIELLRMMRDQCKDAQIGNSDTAAFYAKAIDSYDEVITQLACAAETLTVPASCKTCSDQGMYEIGDPENGPDASDIVYCHCDKGKERSDSDEAAWEKRTHASNI